MRLIHVRLQPFETAFAAIVVSQGLITLSGSAIVDPSAELLTHWMALAYNVAYTLAGVAILIGLIWPRGDVEGGGLVLLGLLLVARAILFGQALGWGARAVTSLTFALFLAFACGLRFGVLLLFKPRPVRPVRPKGPRP
jgi:hypothetical protein